MSRIVAVSRDALETLGAFRFPPQLDKRLQELTDRNNEGLITAAERDQLEGLTELSDKIALHRAQVRILLAQNTP